MDIPREIISSPAAVLRRREIRNNGGLKYNECDLNYITATFPSRPLAYLFRLFCSWRSRRRRGSRSRADLRLLITWLELNILKPIIFKFPPPTFPHKDSPIRRTSSTPLLFSRASNRISSIIDDVVIK